MKQPQQYTKKPVTILAIQYDGTNEDAIMAFMGVTHLIGVAGKSLIIPTLEGNHTASVGDFIIQGVKGEFYPCKPDIFAQTYNAGAGLPQERVVRRRGTSARIVRATRAVLAAEQGKLKKQVKNLNRILHSNAGEQHALKMRTIISQVDMRIHSNRRILAQLQYACELAKPITRVADVLRCDVCKEPITSHDAVYPYRRDENQPPRHMRCVNEDGTLAVPASTCLHRLWKWIGGGVGQCCSCGATFAVTATGEKNLCYANVAFESPVANGASASL